MVAVLVMLFLVWLSLSNSTYLLFHVLAELSSIVIAFTIFLLTWNGRRTIKNSYLLILGMSCFFTGGLDLIHTLAFRGMNLIPGTGLTDPDGANMATQLWLSARYIQSVTLAAAPLFYRRKVNLAWVLLIYSLVTGLLLLSIFVLRIFPDALLDQGGLTPFKIVSEYVIIFGFVIGVLGLRRMRESFDRQIFHLLQAGLLIQILSEFVFTEYLREYDFMNAAGHFLKIVAFLFIYKAIVEIGFRQPNQLLFRELSLREQALRESEARERARAAQLQAIMDAAPLVIWIAHDAEASVVTGNRPSYELLRMPLSTNQSLSAPPEVVPRHFKVFDLEGNELAPRDLPLQRCAASGKPVREFEEELIFEDGERRRLYGNVTPLFDDEGRPAGAVGAFVDITARVRIEEALQESEERYRGIFETMGEALTLHEIILDERGEAYDFRLLQVNPAFERMTNTRREQVEGKTIRELVPNVSAEWIERLGKVAATGAAQRFEIYNEALDKHFEVMVYKVGELRVASFMIDITERYQSQAALQQSEARLRRLVDANIIGITYFDEQGNVLLANDAFLGIVGYTRDDYEAGLVNLVRLTPSEYQAADRRAIAEAHQSGACTPYEKEYLRKDGKRVPVLIGFAHFDGGAAPFICFVIDLTRQKQAEISARDYAAQLERYNRELARANDELQEFAFVASHDLQEPLRKIQAFGERLIQREKDRLDDDSRDYLQRMLAASGRMRSMIEDLLSLSRVTTRGEPFRQVDLHAIIHEVLSDLEVRIERSGGVVEVGELPKIEADPAQMRQLFQNLIGNALKFHRPDVPPQVKLYHECTPDEKSVIIYVEDNGIGFDERFLSRIFQPFQRLHGRAEFEGSGIGLAVCRKITERHYGSLTARSAPGKGSTFIVTLPVQQPIMKDNKGLPNEDRGILKDKGYQQ